MLYNILHICDTFTTFRKNETIVPKFKKHHCIQESAKSKNDIWIYEEKVEQKENMFSSPEWRERERETNKHKVDHFRFPAYI